MAFRELDEQAVLDIISKYTDELTPQAKAYEAFYRQNDLCGRCGHRGMSRMTIQNDVTGHAFSGDTLVPKAVLQCSACGNTFDPFSHIEIARGNPAAVMPDIPIINPLPQTEDD